MKPMTISRNTSMAAKRVAFRHALGLRCAGINGIVLSATACSPVRLTPALTRGQPTEPKARKGDRRVERHVRRDHREIGADRDRLPRRAHFWVPELPVGATTWTPRKPLRSIACCTNPEALAWSMKSLM